MAYDASANGRSSRSRGHAFERKMAKYLSALLGVKFNRTPASGGHAIKGDLYEALHEATDWSKLELYCRTSRSISFENLLCDRVPSPKLVQWIDETGPDSVWFVRTRPGRVFVVCDLRRVGTRITDLPHVWLKGKNGHTWAMFNVGYLAYVEFDFSKLVPA